MRKRFSSIVLVLSMLLSLMPVAANAAESTSKTNIEVSNDSLMLYINSYAAYKNNEYFEIDENNLQVSPVIFDDRTLVPARFIGETFDCEVLWNGPSQEVTIQNGAHIIKCRLNSTTAEVDGKVTPLDVPAQLINDRTMLPLRFLVENLGRTVEYYNGLIIIGNETMLKKTIQSDLNHIIEEKFKCNMTLRKELKNRIPVYSFSNAMGVGNKMLVSPRIATNGYFLWQNGNIPYCQLPVKDNRLNTFTIYNDKIYYLCDEGGSDAMGSPAQIYSCDLYGNNVTLLADDAEWYGHVSITNDKLYYHTNLIYYDGWIKEQYGIGDGNLNVIDLKTGQISTLVKGNGENGPSVDSVHVYDDIIIYSWSDYSSGDYSDRKYGYRWLDTVTGESGNLETEGYSYAPTFKNPKIRTWNNAENNVYFYTSGDVSDDIKEIRVHYDETGEDYAVVSTNAYYISIRNITDKYIYYTETIRPNNAMDSRGMRINGYVRTARVERPDI